MLTTAEAADVMKKPIHEEIIILQNYFKSRRAETDGVAGCWGQAAVTPGVLPSSSHLQGLDNVALEGREPPSLLHQGLGKACMRITKEKQNVAQKNVASEPAGNCQCGFCWPSSQDGWQLATNSPAHRQEGWQLSAKTTCKTHPSLRSQPRRWTRS